MNRQCGLQSPAHILYLSLVEHIKFQKHFDTHFAAHILCTHKSKRGQTNYGLHWRKTSVQTCIKELCKANPNSFSHLKCFTRSNQTEKRINLKFVYEHEFKPKKTGTNLGIHFEMEPLRTTKQVMIWVCLHPDNASSLSNYKRVARFVLPRMLFIFFVGIILSIGSFTLKYFKTRLEDCLFAFMASVNCIGTFSTIVIAYFTRHQAPIMLKELTTIYDASEYLYIYVNVDDRIEQINFISISKMPKWIQPVFCLKQTKPVNGCGRYIQNLP